MTLTGAGFFDSLPYHAARWLDHQQTLSFARIDLRAGVDHAQPKVRVHYFTAGHVGSTPWWEKDEGNRCLVAVSRYLEAIGGVGYWSSNEAIRPVFRNRFPGVWCEPKQAGTNRLIEHTSCAFIFSSKPQVADEAVLNLLGLERDIIRRAREFEDIRQFVFRGALRRPDFDGDYDIYVYDHSQAEDLAAYLRGNGINDVQSVPVEQAGVMDIGRPKPTTAALAPMTLQEKRVRDRERKREERARQKAEDEANGAARRPRGRPRTKGRNSTESRVTTRSEAARPERPTPDRAA
ncbi:hypothetical protein JNW90_16120 [Micromonospora sp. STR1s_5]|nr:hypothetical protein [Micromonospora sp. STR1s_5]